MTRSNTLGREERLKSRKLIDHLFKSGQRFSAGSFRVSYELVPGTYELKFGITAGTRHFKRATDRNRIKRLGREAWRLHNAELKQLLTEKNAGLHVFLIYTSREIPVFEQVREQLAKVLASLFKIINEKIPSDT